MIGGRRPVQDQADALPARADDAPAVRASASAAASKLFNNALKLVLGYSLNATCRYSQDEGPVSRYAQQHSRGSETGISIPT